MPATIRVMRAFCAQRLSIVLVAVLSHACASAAPDTGRRADRSGATERQAVAGAPATPRIEANRETSVISMSSAPPAMMLTDSEICEARAYFSERKQLDVYMMIDDSGSMIPWWLPTVDALNLFFQDPDSAGISVGMQFFGSACEPESYANPRVPIAALPDNAAALQQAFPAIPLNETATLPALQGAIQHARSWATQHPDATVIVLLVTDGLPEECNSTIENVTQVAREGYEGTPSIATWVVGLGDLGALDAFAAAGGTGKALITDPTASQQLSAALNNIRSAALPCDFKLPSADGVPVQPDRVNLRHTGTDGAETTIGAVKDRESCDPTQGGWYFDDADAPTRIIACQQSCQRLNALNGEIKVLLGCPTVVVAPD
jgi:hypothetical protein